MSTTDTIQIEDAAIQKLIDSRLLEGKRTFSTDRVYTEFIDHTAFDPIRSYPEVGRPWKPVGLWYSVGSGWIEYCMAEFSGVGEYIYEIELNPEANILLLDSVDAVTPFAEQYKIDKDDLFHIDWQRVARDYDGIEVCPYYDVMRCSGVWYSTWDAASGCVWRANTVKKVTLLARYDIEIDECVTVKIT